jgi:hypothetical protein
MLASAKKVRPRRKDVLGLYLVRRRDSSRPICATAGQILGVGAHGTWLQSSDHKGRASQPDEYKLQVFAYFLRQSAMLYRWYLTRTSTLYSLATII